VLFLVPLVADSQLFWDQARTQDLNIPAVIGSAGFGSPVFPERFGPAGVEGAYNVEPPALANMNLDSLDPDVQTLVTGWLADFERAHGKPCLVHCGDGIGGAYVLVKDVLPRALAEAGNVDSASIVAAAGKTDIPAGSTPQGFGVKFSPPGAENVGDNAAAYSTIMQWQNGELNVVWPREIAGAEPVFPMPTWDRR
jgi:branched-chain amino acid transport system substrate-binding protein